MSALKQVARRKGIWVVVAMITWMFVVMLAVGLVAHLNLTLLFWAFLIWVLGVIIGMTKEINDVRKLERQQMRSISTIRQRYPERMRRAG